MNVLSNGDNIGMWNTIKNILRKNQGVCIIIEDGKPILVVSKFEEYQKLLDKQSIEQTVGGQTEQELSEKINQDILDWQTKQAEEAPEIDLAEESNDEVKIEELPIV